MLLRTVSLRGWQGMSGSAGEILFVIPGLHWGVTSAVTTMWAIMALMTGISWLATRHPTAVPGRLQAALELTVEGLLSFFASVLGPERARRALPLLASLFLFILASNYVSLLPGSGRLPGLAAPTANWGTTAGLALIVFVQSLAHGLRAKGVGYFRRFVEPRAMAPLLIPLGIIEEFSRPFSLSLRLVANVFAGETLIQSLLAVFPYILPVVPLLLETFFGFIQAFIFAFLAALYLNMAVED